MSRRKKILSAVLAVSILFTCMAFYSIRYKNRNDGYEFIIGMSQANLNDPWRIAMNHEISQEAQLYSNIKVVFRDADGDADKQVKDIDELCKSGIGLLIVSMDNSQKLNPLINKVYKTMPVIVLGRAVEGYSYTMYIGNDNRFIGHQAGNLIAGIIGNDNVSIVEIQGSLDDATTTERSEGFYGVINSHPNIQLERTLICNWKLDDARSDTGEVLSECGKKIKLIFAYSDYMALGAYQAARSMGFKPIIIGIDGLDGKNGGLSLVKSGILQATFTCATGGKEAVDYAVKILNGKKDLPKKIILKSNLITSSNVDQYLNKNSKVNTKTM